MRDARAVAGHAVVSLIRCTVKAVGVDKAFAGAVGDGNMAIAAGGVAIAAFVVKTILDFLWTLPETLDAKTQGYHTSLSAKILMQTRSKMSAYIFMTSGF